MKLTKLQIAVAGAVLLVLIIGGTVLVLRGKNTVEKKESAVLPTSAIIPTVDSSVKVSLASVSEGKDVTLQIDGIPDATQTIDYELSYLTKQQGLQGVIGTITLENEKNYEKELTLGTCSSGTCVYHQVLGKIRLTLKFVGDYGEKIFEKEFEL